VGTDTRAHLDGQSKGSAVIERDQGAQRSSTGLRVVPDGGGESEKPLEHPGDHTTSSPAAVAFEVEVDLQSGVDRFDELAKRLEQGARGPAAVVAVRRSHERDAVVSREGLELLGAIALVGEDCLAGAQQFGLGLKEVPCHRATVRPSSSGLTRAKVTGRPVGVHTRWSRSPQKKREWLAQ